MLRTGEKVDPNLAVEAKSALLSRQFMRVVFQALYEENFRLTIPRQP